MKVVVTGATGFIGRRLVAALLERGDEVLAITRDVQRAESLLPDVAIMDWETFRKDIGIGARELNAIVHLAGEPISGRWSEQRKKAIYESRVWSTRALIEDMARSKKKPHVLIVGSAIGYYGDRGGERLIEESGPGTGFLAMVCRDWEMAAMEATALGVRVVRLRTGIVLGPGGGVLRAMLLPYRLGLGGPIGDGRQWLSWIHIDDEVGLILHAIDSERVEGALNAAAPSPVTNQEFARVLGRVLRRPAVLAMPAFAVRLVLGEAAEMLLASQRVLPAKALDTGYKFRHETLEPALADCLRA